MPGVDTTADGDVHRHTPKLRQIPVLNGPTPLAAAKDLDRLATTGTVQVAHVLDHTQDGHVRPAEQSQRPAGIHQRQILGRRHDQDAVNVYRVQQCLLGLPGAGRQVEKQKVELSPQHVLQSLADDVSCKEWIGHHGIGVAHHKPHRHHLQAKALQWRDVGRGIGATHRHEPLGRPLAPHAEHQGNVRPVQVGVEQADASAALPQSQRQVDGHGCLADAPLAAGHRQHVRNVWNAQNRCCHNDPSITNLERKSIEAPPTFSRVIPLSPSCVRASSCPTCATCWPG